jgi:oligoribonuclease
MSETVAQLPATLPKSDQNLIWIDCEMTGLDPESDRLIEIAVIVTGAGLTPRIEGPVLVIHQSDAQLDKMDAWNKGTHGRSGLIDKVKASTVTEEQAEQQILDFVAKYAPKGSTPMCGNSIGQDRRFLVKYMPKLEAFFHYRNVDVSTLKELAKRWRPEVYNSFKKQQKAHGAGRCARVHRRACPLPRALSSRLTALERLRENPEACDNCWLGCIRAKRASPSHTGSLNALTALTSLQRPRP